MTKQEMPAIIYGTAWKKEKTKDLVEMAINTGFKGIDTACQPKHYNEVLVGLGIESSKIPREELYVQTKFTPFKGQDPDDCPYDPDSELEEQVVKSIECSLKNLKTDYLDALILHSPLKTIEDTIRVWNVFDGYYQKGVLLRLGLSNCYDFNFFKLLRDTVENKPSILQNRFYKDSNYDQKLRAYCLEHSITYQSFWTLTANPNILSSEQFQKLEKKYDLSPAQILFSALSSSGIVPLTGTSSLQHMKDDLQIHEISLDKKDKEQIMQHFNS